MNYIIDCNDEEFHKEYVDMIDLSIKCLFDHFKINNKKPLIVEINNYEIETEFRKLNGYFNELENEYEIALFHENLISETIMTLCHEFVHFKQCVEKRYKYDLNYSKYVIFERNIYHLDKVEYYDRPWEIEAYNLEKQLAFMCYETLKNNVIFKCILRNELLDIRFKSL